MYGDSTTLGTTMKSGHHVRSTENTPALIQYMLQDKFGSDVFVENHGVGGATCDDFLNSGNYVRSSWVREMLRSNADIVVMNVGINDVMRSQTAGFSECYRRLAMITKAFGKTFIIETPNPVDREWNANVGALASAERAIAEERGLPLIDHWTTLQAKRDDWKALLSDGIHPSDAMYELKAASDMRVLAPIVASRLN
jgi:acyl-CoA thioesterase I